MSDTRIKILNSAERLFAEHGIQGVSVRRILSEAGINPALAHYYFGSRAKLVEEVLRRRIIPMHEERLALLEEVEKKSGPDGPSLENVLRAFSSPAIRLLDEQPEFARLVGYLHVVRDEHLRVFEGDPVLTEIDERFNHAARKALPPYVSDLEFLWRRHFVSGVLSHAMTNFRDLQLPANHGDEAPDMERLLEEIVAFCAAGLRVQSAG